MPRHFLPLAAVVIVLLAASPARATVLVPTDLSELSRGAVAIVRGTVVDVRAGWAEGRRRVETLVTVSVQQVLKGDPGRTVAFKVPGGDMGRYRSVMIGAPSFRPGEEVILFLGAQPPSMPYLLGFSQGVYRVSRDGSGAARVLSPTLVADRESSQNVQRGDPARRPLTVEEFSEQVHAAIQAAPRSDGESPRAKTRPRRVTGGQS